MKCLFTDEEISGDITLVSGDLTSGEMTFGRLDCNSRHSNGLFCSGLSFTCAAGLQCNYSDQGHPPIFFYNLANGVRVMKQQNGLNLNFVVLRYIINFVKIHCSDVRFSLASLQEIFLGGLGWSSRTVTFQIERSKADGRHGKCTWLAPALCEEPKWPNINGCVRDWTHTSLRPLSGKALTKHQFKKWSKMAREILVTSPIVINVPTRGLLAAETMHAIVRWLANLNIKRNMTSMFVNKKHRYCLGLNHWFANCKQQCK